MMTYALQVGFCWILLYGVYYFGLSKVTFFTYNRFYLLLSLVLGLLIPIIGPYLEPIEEIPNFNAYIQNISYVTTSQEESFNWMLLWESLYLLISLFIFSRTVVGLIKIFSLYKNGEKEEKSNYTIIHTDKVHLPFSFFKSIYLSKHVPLKENIKEIIMHEEVHINSWHSIDILFIEIMHALFWFNPILIFYKKSLKASHEYLADRLLLNHISKEEYSMLLIRQSTSGMELSLSNQFFNSFIKSRIDMINKKKTDRKFAALYFTAIPIVLILLYGFTNYVEVPDTSNLQAYIGEAVLPIQNTIEEKFNINTQEKNSTKESKNSDVEKQVKKLLKDFENDVISSNTFFDKLHYLVKENPNSLQEIREILQEHNKKGSKVVTINENKLINVQYKEKEFKLPNADIPAKLEDCVTNSNAECTVDEIVKLMAPLVIFPINAAQKGTEGVVKLKFIVTKTGNISSPETVFGFDKFAEMNVLSSFEKIRSKLKFKPAKKKGKAVNSEIIISFLFTYGDSNLKNSLSESVNAVIMRLRVQNGQSSLNQSDEKVYQVVDEKPYFKGGDDALLKALASELKYPEEAKNNKIEGTVIVKMVIRKNGDIDNIEVLRKIPGGCSEEAVRALKVISKDNWEPAVHFGQKVNVTYTLPIRFKLEGK